eukprot:TRINITY_DN1359_c0_g1_i1.p1 TRINITY_DN1359_c0_g1~~TRINITY_DN1359_c0_g1_i1.p1  ORF type:complete len:174 (+),score=53.79 TRINITY_DN1359_c0_g1_i1:78-599(+)
MPRAKWKGPFIDSYVLRKFQQVMGQTPPKPIKIHSRRSTILPEFVGYRFEVYNGRKFLPVSITPQMVGHKFGEFSPTRIYPTHASKKDAAEQKASGAAATEAEDDDDGISEALQAELEKNEINRGSIEEETETEVRRVPTKQAKGPAHMLDDDEEMKRFTQELMAKLDENANN